MLAGAEYYILLLIVLFPQRANHSNLGKTFSVEYIIRITIIVETLSFPAVFFEGGQAQKLGSVAKK